jgi:hypothetical protein
MLRHRTSPGPGVIVAAILVLLAAGASRVCAEGACCLADGCLAAADEAECNGFGGVFLPGADCATDPCAPGACCNDLNCAIADAFSCITAGREFGGAGTTCLDDPCEAGVGACCLPDETCLDASPADCSDAGGTWLGAGTGCDAGDCTSGACCAPGSCTTTTQFQCELAGGIFVAGPGCGPGACDVPGDCPADSILSQPRQSPQSFMAYVSEESADLRRSENFTGLVGTIEGLRWWGLELFFDGEVFVGCDEGSPQFEIQLFRDVGGTPGELVCAYTLTADRVGTGIAYGESELQQYTISLPEPCVLIDGWVSIVGLGDPDCWFLWMGGLGGDQVSYCDNCLSSVETDDLGLCVAGSFGGVFGACCDLSTAQCDDDVEITECAEVGKRFVPDTSCGDLEPVCVPELGACCYADGAPCSALLPDECVQTGGQWLGAGTDCVLCPVVGACCFGADRCVIITQLSCLAEGGTWAGPGSLCEDCPEPPSCDPSSLATQLPSPRDDFLAGSSEATSPFRRWESFSAIAGAIEALTWWGVDLDSIEGTNSFQECEDPDPTFEVTFHVDAGGAPGAIVSTCTLLATRTPTGISYLGTELNEYTVTLPEPCVLVNGWVSIVGLGDPECWFLWMSSATGDGVSWCEGCLPAEQDFDLSLCLAGSVGGIVGACCDLRTAVCEDAVDIADCTGPGQRFVPDATCDMLEPACGILLGACCLGTSGCTIVDEEDCAIRGGRWLGTDTLCAQCPCVLGCPPEAVPEDEPRCAARYVDQFNGGCDGDPVLFSPMALGVPVCGESGVFEQGVELVPEFDWYQIELVRALELALIVQAEFPVRGWIIDGNDGCPGTIVASAATLPCETLTITADVDPGTHWLVVAPASASDLATCGARYTVLAVQVCPADTNLDEVVNVDDLITVILAWGTDDPPADVDANGTVNVDDLVQVILGWGPCR